MLFSHLLKQMDNFGYTGTGAQPGSLAPQQLVCRRAANKSGLMERKDPHFNTFGYLNKNSGSCSQKPSRVELVSCEGQYKSVKALAGTFRRDFDRAA